MLPKKFKIAFAAFAFMGLQSQAQLTIQSGATFNMQSGATVTVQGNVDNAGTLTNDGSLKVQGNYTNTNAYAGTGTLEMNGTGNSNITAGASSIANLLINKTAAIDVVKLTATTVVTSSFNLTNGIFTTDPIANPSFTLTSPATATYTFAAGKEVIGSVKKTSWTTGVARVFNQTNMLITTNGGTAPTDVTVTMIPQTAGGDPTLNERRLKRKYGFAQTGGTGFTVDVRFPYIQAIELNTNIEANLVPWHLVGGTEWNAILTPVTRNAANGYIATTGIPAALLAEEWKLADPNYTMNVTANLRGPWNGVSAMNTTLLSGGIIPLSQPFNTTPFNYAGTESVASIPANVVDWVLIEHRKPATGLPQDALFATISGSKAGFLLSNGTVVGLDGITPISVTITKQGTSFITIRHRNHLGVMSNALNSNVIGTFANDYSVLTNSYKPSGASSDPVVLLAGAGGKYGLWAGDANKSGSVNASDISVIKAAIAGSLSGYLFTDVNLTNSINATDISITKSTISLSGTGSGTTALTSNGKNKSVKTNIPDPIIED